MGETRQSWTTYTDFAVNEAAIPVIPGRTKSRRPEKFCPARTLRIRRRNVDGRRKRRISKQVRRIAGANFAQLCSEH